MHWRQFLWLIFEEFWVSDVFRDLPRPAGQFCHLVVGNKHVLRVTGEH